jgi:apolipoprotein N-acyltransferase
VAYRSAVTAGATTGRRRPLPRRAPWSAPLPLPVASLLAVAGGLALHLSFPHTGLWALAPLGVAALTLAAAGRRAAAAAGLGMLGGLAFFLPLLSWAGVYVGYVAWLPLAALEALYVAGFAALVPAVLRCPGGLAVRAGGVAGLWVAAEAARARTPFGGFGWGRLAFSQADSPAAGLAALGGPALVSFAVAGAGALLAVGLLAAGPLAVRPLGRPRRLVPPVAGAVALVLAGAAVPTPTAAQAGTLSVAGVQGNVPRPGLEFNAERRAVLDNHVRGTRQLADRVAAGSAPRPDVVVWPENASDIDPLRNDDAYRVISDAAEAVDAPVLLGAVLVRDDDRLAKVAFVWEPGEGPVQRYVKRRPVPFAEYVPYRSFFRKLSSAVDLVRRDFVPGDEVGVVDAAGARLGVLICFEVVEDGLVADAVAAGAQLLVVQTNNATFGYTDESEQQLAMSRLRAIEYGRAVAHVSTVGVSALVAPDGSVVDGSGLFTADVLQARLPLRTGTTPARRLGAAPELALAVLGLLAAAAGSVAHRRVRRDGPPAGGTAAPDLQEAGRT